jgi:hypothetical protein
LPNHQDWAFPFPPISPAGDRQAKESRNLGFDRRLYSKQPIQPEPLDITCLDPTPDKCVKEAIGSRVTLVMSPAGKPGPGNRLDRLTQRPAPDSSLAAIRDGLPG